MRRKDREITDRSTILSIVRHCELLHLGLHDPDDPMYPYVVPVNFAPEDKDGTLYLYFHGARDGRKFDLMQRTGVCSFTMECNAAVETVPEHRDITTRYESVMGKGKLRLLDGDEAIHALQLIVDFPAVSRGFDWNRDVLPRTAVWEISVTEMTGKANHRA